MKFILKFLSKLKTLRKTGCKVKEYHEPDSRWEIFGKDDFDTYNKDYVVKGLFHSNVPKDIVDAYQVAEYMMAHAYYLYPLYDEASSKVLRISEMAVKLRCEELGISLMSTVYNKKLGAYQLKSLGNLMDELCGLEPNKKLEWQFDVSRNLRNSYMHPSRHSFMGGMSLGFIQRGVILFNKLFLPNDLFILLNEKLADVQSKLIPFSNQATILSDQKGYCLIKEIRICAAALVNSQWVYCLTCFPIIKDVKKHIEKHNSPSVLIFHVKDLKFVDGSIKGIQVINGQEVNWALSTEDFNIEVNKSFQNDIDNASESDRGMYLHEYEEEVAKAEYEFWYTWMHRVGKE
jgi:hypothetical protein